MTVAELELSFPGRERPWYECIQDLIAGKGEWATLPYFELEMFIRRNWKKGDDSHGLPPDLKWLLPKIVGPRWARYVDMRERPDAYWVYQI